MRGRTNKGEKSRRGKNKTLRETDSEKSLRIHFNLQRYPNFLQRLRFHDLEHFGKLFVERLQREVTKTWPAFWNANTWSRDGKQDRYFGSTASSDSGNYCVESFATPSISTKISQYRYRNIIYKQIICTVRENIVR